MSPAPVVEAAQPETEQVPSAEEHKKKLQSEEEAVVEDVKEDEKENDDEDDEDDDDDDDDDDDKEDGANGASKQSGNEKKSRKAMLKLGMKPITGVNRVTIKRTKNLQRILGAMTSDKKRGENSTGQGTLGISVSGTHV